MKEKNIIILNILLIRNHALLCSVDKRVNNILSKL